MFVYPRVWSIERQTEVEVDIICKPARLDAPASVPTGRPLMNKKAYNKNVHASLFAYISRTIRSCILGETEIRAFGSSR